MPSVDLNSCGRVGAQPVNLVFLSYSWYFKPNPAFCYDSKVSWYNQAEKPDELSPLYTVVSLIQTRQGPTRSEARGSIIKISGFFVKTDNAVLNALPSLNFPVDFLSNS